MGQRQSPTEQSSLQSPGNSAPASEAQLPASQQQNTTPRQPLSGFHPPPSRGLLIQISAIVHACSIRGLLAYT